MEKHFDHVTGGYTPGRESNLQGAMEFYNLPINAFDIEECGDEETGVRYGNALKRRGWATKLGGGGRNRGNTYAYQIWAVVKSEYRFKCPDCGNTEGIFEGKWYECPKCGARFTKEDLAVKEG